MAKREQPDWFDVLFPVLFGLASWGFGLAICGLVLFVLYIFPGFLIPIALWLAWILGGIAIQQNRDEKSRKIREQEQRQYEEEYNTPEQVELRELEAKLEKERETADFFEECVQYTSAAVNRWQQYYTALPMEEIDKMSGTEFEQFLKRLFKKNGYTNVKGTPRSGDQGGDVTCTAPDGNKVVIQAKRWRDNVGTAAIQETLGALLHYGADIGLVITQSRFTPGAKKLAARDKRIQLIDRQSLEEMVSRAFPPKVPDFCWVEYDRIIEGDKNAIYERKQWASRTAAIAEKGIRLNCLAKDAHAAYKTHSPDTY